MLLVRTIFGAVHQITALAYKTLAFRWRKLQNEYRFLWLLSTYITFPTGARSPKHPRSHGSCLNMLLKYYIGDDDDDDDVL